MLSLEGNRVSHSDPLLRIMKLNLSENLLNHEGALLP